MPKMEDSPSGSHKQNNANLGRLALLFPENEDYFDCAWQLVFF